MKWNDESLHCPKQFFITSWMWTQANWLFCSSLDQDRNSLHWSADERLHAGQCNEKAPSLRVLKSSLRPVINPSSLWSITFIRKIKKVSCLQWFVFFHQKHTIGLLQFAYSQDVIISHWGLCGASEQRFFRPLYFPTCFQILTETTWAKPTSLQQLCL